MTPYEYGLKIKAENYKSVDRQHQIAVQAWMNLGVQASDKKGHSKFKSFDDFFDYSDAIRRVDQQLDAPIEEKGVIRDSKLLELLKKAQGGG